MDDDSVDALRFGGFPHVTESNDIDEDDVKVVGRRGRGIKSYTVSGENLPNIHTLTAKDFSGIFSKNTVSPEIDFGDLALEYRKLKAEMPDFIPNFLAQDAWGGIEEILNRKLSIEEKDRILSGNMMGYRVLETRDNLIINGDFSSKITGWNKVSEDDIGAGIVKPVLESDLKKDISAIREGCIDILRALGALEKRCGFDK